MADEDYSPQVTLTPTEFIKQKSVSLYFKCIELNSKSINDEDKYGFIKTVKDLAILLERYTDTDKKKEIKAWYKQLEDIVTKIKNNRSDLVENTKKKMILDECYTYALEVHEHNGRILMNSPIIEITAEGELDITSDDIIEIIQGGKRKDDGGLVAQ